MPENAANDLPKATNALGNCLSRLQTLHPKAVLDALDAYTLDYEELRADCNEILNTEHDQEISNA